MNSLKRRGIKQLFCHGTRPPAGAFQERHRAGHPGPGRPLAGPFEERHRGTGARDQPGPPSRSVPRASPGGRRLGPGRASPPERSESVTGRPAPGTRPGLPAGAFQERHRAAGTRDQAGAPRRSVPIASPGGRHPGPCRPLAGPFQERHRGTGARDQAGPPAGAFQERHRAAGTRDRAGLSPDRSKSVTGEPEIGRAHV